MKKKIFLFIFVFLFSFFPIKDINFSDSLSNTEREIFIRQIRGISERLNHLRWTVDKLKLSEDLNSKSYLVLDLENNSEVLSKNSEDEYIIASITKLMSAVVAKENIDLSEKITLTPPMLGHNRESPSLTLNTSVSGKDLLMASLIQSTNDASEALTYFMEEGELVALMNKKAQEIGMKNTRFHDAHGLAKSNNRILPENMATASDIAKLITYITENHPEIMEITKDENFSLPCSDGMCTFKNMNNTHGVDGFLGGKGGYLRRQYSYTGIFEFNETPYTLVLLSSDVHRNSDIQKISEWLKRRP